jgi:hypothetical protein
VGPNSGDRAKRARFGNARQPPREIDSKRRRHKICRRIYAPWRGRQHGKNERRARWAKWSVASLSSPPHTGVETMPVSHPRNTARLRQTKCRIVSDDREATRPLRSRLGVGSCESHPSLGRARLRETTASPPRGCQWLTRSGPESELLQQPKILQRSWAVGVKKTFIT